MATQVNHPHRTESHRARAAHLEAILHIGARFRDVDATGKSRDLFPRACLTGIQLSPAVIEAPAETCCVIGAEIGELTEKCQLARSVEERLGFVERWITVRLARSHAAHPAVAWVTQRLEQSDGRESIAALRARTGLGNTRLVDTFRQQVGTTPKRYARVLRFRRALVLLQAGGALADSATAAGFYDQPHMNADFREFAGMTPAQFVAAARYPNTASLAEPA